MASLTSMLTPQDYSCMASCTPLSNVASCCEMRALSTMSGAYPSALGLAALAREELGKSSFLQEKRPGVGCPREKHSLRGDREGVG